MQRPDEGRELGQVIDRLSKKFPDAPRDEIEGAVTVEYWRSRAIRSATS